MMKEEFVANWPHASTSSPSGCGRAGPSRAGGGNCDRTYRSSNHTLLMTESHETRRDALCCAVRRDAATQQRDTLARLPADAPTTAPRPIATRLADHRAPPDRPPARPPARR